MSWASLWFGCTKCLIAYSEAEALRIMDALGLDKTVWAPRFYFDSGSGRKWDTIVVVPPPDGWKNCHHNWIHEVLKTKSDHVVLM